MELAKVTTQKKSIFLKNLVAIMLLMVFTLANVALLAPNLFKALSYSFLRELAKQQFLFQTRHLSELEGKYFIVRYYPKDANIARIVLENADNTYGPVTDRLNYRHKGKIPVVIYPSREALGQSFGWEANESAMGVYWAGAIRILSPNQWIYEEDSKEIAKIFSKSGPMAHEFTHLAVDYYTRGNYTRWFTEGVAQYIEYQLTGFEFSVKGNSLNQNLYAFAAMDKDFDNLGNQGLAYRQSLVAVKYIVETYGEAKLYQILKELRKGQVLDKSMEAALGVDLQQFELNFYQWVKLNSDRLEARN